MTRPPYNDARRVFWIVDNGSSHRGAASVARMRERYPRLTLIHGPVHASWLNQVEIYFSIVQRKILSPNDFPSLNALAERLLDFQSYWESTAKPSTGNLPGKTWKTSSRSMAKSGHWPRDLRNTCAYF